MDEKHINQLLIYIEKQELVQCVAFETVTMALTGEAP